MKIFNRFIRIEKNKNMLIVSPPGGGKTTFLKNLLKKSFLNKYQYICILSADSKEYDFIEDKKLIDIFHQGVIYSNISINAEKDIFKGFINMTLEDKLIRNILFIIDDFELLKESKYFNNYLDYFNKDNTTIIASSRSSLNINDVKFKKTILL